LADGRSLPLSDDKPEGLHAAPWMMPGTAGLIELGPDRFIDAAVCADADAPR
jgi:hypothetical protein